MLVRCHTERNLNLPCVVNANILNVDTKLPSCNQSFFQDQRGTLAWSIPKYRDDLDVRQCLFDQREAFAGKLRRERTHASYIRIRSRQVRNDARLHWIGYLHEHDRNG